MWMKTLTYFLLLPRTAVLELAFLPCNFRVGMNAMSEFRAGN